MPRRLALFLDGTTDTEIGNTNVWRLKSLCAARDKTEVEQLTFYSVGVGTARDEKIRGGALGYGIDDVLQAAYLWLVETFEPGDDIYIFGFSRGAFTARSLAGLISRCGLVNLGAPLSIQQLYDRYKRSNDVRTIHQLNTREGGPPLNVEEQWILQYCREVEVHFVGVWDTVAALNDVQIAALTGGDHRFLDANLRKSERHAYHALAIDENRLMYDATLFTIYADKTKPFEQPRAIADAEQRWFCGSHSNVGGGNYSDLAAQIPLRWLMSKAQALGLAFRQQVAVDESAYTAELYDSFAATDIPDVLLKLVQQHGARYWRPIARPPVEQPQTFIHTINETIDRSVFLRFAKDEKYRPQNLLDWAKAYNVDLAAQTTSLRADDPKTKAPD